jgi:hypothetical protein
MFGYNRFIDGGSQRERRKQQADVKENLLFKPKPSKTKNKKGKEEK